MNQHNDQTVTLMELAATFETCIDFLPPAGRKNISRAVEQLRTYGELCRASAGREAVACWCQTCRPITVMDCRMVLCPDCGNKRCPHANDHRNACTGSNEPGQKGSAYENFAAPTAPELPKQGEGGREDHSGNAAEMVAVESIIETMLCAAALLEQSGSVINRREGAALRVQADELRALAKKAEEA